mmetsp:Transcript_74788/g.219071  ORF Transcript_74788/g.219071 Transcript_74788/m.219071 type:complete len:228 (+) Transcript_74788:131-814(+)
MFLGRCCCADVDEGTSQAVAADGTVKVSSSMVPIASYAAITDERLAGAAGAPALQAPRQAAATAHVFASGEQKSPADKQAEKARLRVMVDTFVQKAFRGCPCVYFEPGTHRRLPTEYRLQRDLASLCIMSATDENIPLVTCNIGTIEDIFSCAEDGDGAFEDAVLQQVQPDEKQQLLRVSYGDDQTFTFLEESVESRDMLLECLRILCIYAQASKSPSRSRQTSPAP